MVALISLVAGVVIKFFTHSVVKFIAYKALLLFLFVIILPAVLLKLFFTIKLYMFDLIVSLMDAELLGGFELGAGMVNLTGVAAYIGSHLMLAQGVAVLVSCALSGWIIRMIRG